jgi:Rps23 Pro-64 3,4-dihydroxylase Tpa1-like proline 4-hydroxylase
MEQLEGISYEKPFPHLVIENFYNPKELELIWEELKFYTKSGKLFEAKDFGGVVDFTNSHALMLDELYSEKYRVISNILTVNRKLFDPGILDAFAKIHDCCSIVRDSNWDFTKVRYYHDEEYYSAHTDRSFQFIACWYCYKEPKKFIGGELYLPKYDYTYNCNNNSMIIFPGWVEHEVKKVSIKDSDYYDGYGRYCISSFFGNKGK